MDELPWCSSVPSMEVGLDCAVSVMLLTWCKSASNFIMNPLFVVVMDYRGIILENEVIDISLNQDSEAIMGKRCKAIRETN